ncbi:ArsR family transcriptional regulator [Methanofollis formosanus]|uniref:ArsR family transcriptional regulator n=1 Tax=Methanofollis formosanus TaxID=299308 RepID=A0A8G1A2W7_9EURY|nr:flavodoxin [Methanofollis formosanus]QYZ79443.1 ArsR family transcriptional regulator [Methanofollis formosanus]
MKTCIIFYSATGQTRVLATVAAGIVGADLVEVRDLAGYSKATMYLQGAPRARRGEKAAIEPAGIDVGAYDLVVVGTPVWAWSPTPAANAIVAALKNCEGKRAVAFATSGGMPGSTLEKLSADLEARGMTVAGTFHVSVKDLKKGEGPEELARVIRSASGA